MNREEYKRLADYCYNDYLKFLEVIRIPFSGFDPKKFIEIAEPWQITEAKVIGNVLRNVWDRDNKFPYNNVWITRPRGHDKTSSIARGCIWAILFPRPSFKERVPLDIRVVAVDAEQAQILVDIASNIIRLNELQNIIKINKQELIGPGGKANIISADYASAYGKIIHVLIFDELTHWDTPKSKKLFDALWSGRSKVQNSCTIILTNAGYKNTWQYDLLKNIKASNCWYIDDNPGRLASWHSEETLKEISFGLPPQEVRRLLYNEWIENETRSIHNYILENSIENVNSTLHGVIIGVDYASKVDLTAVTVLEIYDSFMYVKDIIVGQFTHERLQNEILKPLYSQYRDKVITKIAADAYQMEYTAEMMKKEGINIELIRPTSATNKRMFSLLLKCCESKILMFKSPYLGAYQGTTLETEARYCTIQISPPKIVTPAGVHDDRLHSIAYAIFCAYKNNMLFHLNIERKDIENIRDRFTDNSQTLRSNLRSIAREVTQSKLIWGTLPLERQIGHIGTRNRLLNNI